MSGNEPARGAQRAWGKDDWRAHVLSARKALSAEEHQREAEQLATAVVDVAAGHGTGTVACYVPFDTEPGSLDLVDGLRDLGVRVLLPVVPKKRAPLLWTVYEGHDSLAEGPLPGLLEPAGDRLPPETIAEAGGIFVPALAVDSRGVRLGRGAGYYDRSLPLVDPDADLVGVVRDDEFVPYLPDEPHDARLTSVLTPRAGYRRL